MGQQAIALGSLVSTLSVGRVCMLGWSLLACLLVCAFADHLTETNSTRSLPADEIAALMDLYTRTGGPSWNMSRGWGGGTDPCTWYGIVCSDNHTGILPPSYLGTTRIFDTQAGHVLEINLPYNNLRGPLVESISAFKYLKRLYLDGNYLDSLPTNMGTLDWLEIARLMNNEMANTIPPEIGNCSRLRFLSLARNKFHGTIPDTIVKLQALDTLYLNQNFLTGPLPSGLVNRTLMPNLKNVFLHKNLFGAPAANACYDRYCSP